MTDIYALNVTNKGNKALKTAFWLLNEHFTKPRRLVNKFIEVVFFRDHFHMCKQKQAIRIQRSAKRYANLAKQDSARTRQNR